MDQSASIGVAAPGSADVPLVVDLDGTLLRTDVLLEALLGLVSSRPLAVLSLPGWLAGGRAAFKAKVACGSDIGGHDFPVRAEVLDLLRAERARGRRIYLATATDRHWAEAIAEKIGLFEGVFASDGATNLKGEAKADALVAAFGEGNFDYVGDCAADLPVWARARRAIAVACSPRVAGMLAALRPDHATIAAPRRTAAALVRAMRPHQWIKNCLLFLPAFAAHRFAVEDAALLAMTFVAFCACASGVYMLNDLFDLASDRRHPRKRHRPFASGDLGIATGLLVAPGLFGLGLALAATVSLPLLAVLVSYAGLTFAYTLVLKQHAILDVITLAGLYTIRIVAGAVALWIVLSPWMLGFSIFIFLSLALVKRLTELRSHLAEGLGDPAGRGYRLDDLPVILSLAGSAGYAAVVVLALYIESADMKVLYSSPVGLWIGAGLLLFWISRALLVAQRGEMHDDPIVFAAKDAVSRVTIGLTLVSVVLGSMG